METTEIKKTEIVKARSVWECMSDGLSASFEYMGASLRGLWPVVIGFSILAPVLYLVWGGMLNKQMMDGTFNLAFTTHETGAVLRVLGMLSLPLLLGLMDAFVHGGIIWRQRQLTAMGYIPHTPAWREWRGIGRMTLRVIVVALLAVLLITVISLIAVAMVWGLLSIIRHFVLGTGLSIALFIVVFLIYFHLVFYLIGVFTHMMMPYFYEEVSLRKSIASAKWALGPVSGTFAVLLIAFVAAFFFGLAFLLPGVVIQIVDLLSMKAIVLGDPGTLPSSLSIWRYIAIVLMFFGSFVCNVVILFPVLYRWGALKWSTVNG